MLNSFQIEGIRALKTLGIEAIAKGNWLYVNSKPVMNYQGVQTIINQAQVKV